MHISKIRKIILEELQKDYSDFESQEEETGMIKSNLSSISKKALELNEILGEKDNLPEWIQEKIAVCDEYMDVIYDYVKYK